MKGLERQHWILALLVVGLGLALRLVGLGDYWPNADEGIYLNAASGDGSRLQALILYNAHPPLFYLVLYAMSVVSTDYVWLRMASVVCGCLAILGLHLFVRRLAGWQAGIAAALMLACSPGAIMLSQVIRPYSMLLASMSFALWLLLCELQEPHRRQRIAYAILLCISLLLHYSAIILLPGIAACILAAKLSGRVDAQRFRQLSILQLPAALVTLGLIGLHIIPELMGSEMQSLARDDGWLVGFYPDSPAQLWQHFLGIFAYGLGPGLVAPTVLLFALGLALIGRDSRSLQAGLVLATLAGALVLAALGLYPFGPTRHSLYLLPLLLLPMAAAIGWSLAAGPRSSLARIFALLVILFLAWLGRDLLGADELPPASRQEQRLHPETVDQAMSILENWPGSQGLLLMDQRCFNTLAPVLGEAAGKAVEGSTKAGYASFDWQGWQVLVTESWVITASRANRDRSDHLLKLLREVETGAPELRLAAREEVVILADGRIPRVVQDFLSLFSEDNPGGALILASHNLENFHVFAVNMRRYLELMN
ncbi:MAG: glycosyltransferase family 39 protein [Planctomycetota bacterium]|jgi:4-amino-4-deoxy-L-arabinose transferase-like glycosyltransferase